MQQIKLKFKKNVSKKVSLPHEITFHYTERYFINLKNHRL